MANTSRSIWIAGIVTVTVIVGLWLASPVVLKHFFSDWQVRASVGDSYGSVNALFSGLALAGVIFAILLQRAELALQRRELELTRNELRRSAEAQESSEAALRKQAALLAISGKATALNALVMSKNEELRRQAGGGDIATYAKHREDLERYERDLEATLSSLYAGTYMLG